MQTTQAHYGKVRLTKEATIIARGIDESVRGKIVRQANLYKCSQGFAFVNGEHMRRAMKFHNI